MSFEVSEHTEARAAIQGTDVPSRARVLEMVSHGEYIHMWNAQEALQIGLQALEMAEELACRISMAHSLVLCARCRVLLGDSTRALAEAETAYKIFDSENLSDGVLDCQCILAGIHALTGNFAHALELIDENAEQIEKSTPQIQTRMAFMQGSIYQSLADYTRALRRYHDAMDICVESGDDRGRASALSSIGSVYFDLGEFATSISYYQQSLVIYQTASDKGGEAWTLERMGTLCTRMGGLEDALVFHRRSMVLRRETSNYRGVASSLFYIGEILSKQGLDDQALIVFQESLSFWESAHDYIGMAETYLGFATLHLNDESELFNTMRANELLVKCLRIAEELGIKRLEMRVHEAFARSYKQIRLYERALRHQEKVQALREIVSGEDVSKQIQQLEIALMRERAEKESERSQSESSELSAALRNLEEMNDNLQKVVQEKNDVFSIVYHDLKNPIAGILVHTSTLERYIERMSTDDIRNTVHAITKTAHRMRDIVTHLLRVDKSETSAEPVLESVNLCAVIRDVVAESSARAYAKSQTIHFAPGAGDIIVSGVQSSLQRCVENFLSNAIKYSPTNRAITLTVEPSHRSGFVRCSVQDEGPGIHPDQVKLLFKSKAQVGSKTTGGEDSSGIGLVSVKRLIEQMSGVVGCNSHLGSGSTFFFEVPVWTDMTEQNTSISQ